MVSASQLEGRRSDSQAARGFSVLRPHAPCVCVGFRLITDSRLSISALSQTDMYVLSIESSVNSLFCVNLMLDD